MNPSYDSNLGGTNPGGPNATGNYSASQSISAGQSAISNFPAPRPVSSGQGDIVLGSSQPKKSKKWLVVVIAIVFIALIAIVVTFLFLNRTKGPGKYEGTMATTKEKFNNYANYVLFGKNSTEDINSKNEILSNQVPYFSKISEDELEVYIKTAEEKYNSFVDAYFEGEEVLGFDAVPSLFQLYPQVVLLNEDTIISQYVSDGLESTREFVNDYYAISGSDNYLSHYIENARALSLLQLQLINEANLSGCMVGNQLNDSCYSPSDDERREYFQYDFAVDSAFQTLYSSAMNSIVDLYDELYDDTKGVQDYDE